MRPLTPRIPALIGERQKGFRPPLSRLLSVLAAIRVLTISGCGGGSAETPPSPPPPAVTVTVSPTSGSILLGNSEGFTATVANATNPSVTWSVNGVPGGSAPTGTITAAGLYTAPGDLPSPAIVQITATSVANPTKSATAQITVTSDISIALLSAATGVELGATQPFRATISSAGHPDTSVRWSLTGATCPTACGAVDLAGNYTAPGILPSPATATITAQSVADPSKQTSAPITITSSFTLQIAAPQGVPAGSSATIVATLAPIPGSNPSTVLSWTLSGPGCSGIACGTLTVVTTQGVGGTVIQGTATYTAPSSAPNPDTVIVTVTPQADPSKKAQATMAVQPGVSVNLSPTTGTVAVNQRVTLTAQVFGTTNTAVSWP